MANERRTMTKGEWLALGEKLFGPNVMKWRFVCPSCGHVQTPEDFREFEGAGATPATSYFNCIGRYCGHMDNDIWSGKQPCNYTSGGLFNLNPWTVIDGDKEYQIFAFDGWNCSIPEAA